MKKTILQIVIVSIIALVFLGIGIRTSSADTLVFDIENTGVNPPSDNYGTITLTLNALNQIEVAVAVNSAYRIGAGFGFNYTTAGPVTISNIQSTDDGNNDGGWVAATPAAPIHLDGFGDFEAGLTADANEHDYSALSFIVSQQGGFTSLSQLQELSTGGGMAALFTTHVYPQNAPGSTGFIGASGVSVPEPTTMLLLGFGLVGLAGVGRKFKK